MILEKHVLSLSDVYDNDHVFKDLKKSIMIWMKRFGGCDRLHCELRSNKTVSRILDDATLLLSNPFAIYVIFKLDVLAYYE